MSSFHRIMKKPFTLIADEAKNIQSLQKKLNKVHKLAQGISEITLE